MPVLLPLSIRLKSNVIRNWNLIESKEIVTMHYRNPIVFSSSPSEPAQLLTLSSTLLTVFVTMCVLQGTMDILHLELVCLALMIVTNAIPINSALPVMPPTTSDSSHPTDACRLQDTLMMEPVLLWLKLVIVHV